MKVKDLIQELSKLPQDEEIDFCSYDNHYDAKVKWDITKEEYEEGYTGTIYLFNKKVRIRSRKMDDDIRFYIPNGITIPTALILYVGGIYVCYSKIKGGFRFHIHEDDEEKAMEIAKQIAHKMEYEHDESQHGVTWETVEFKIVEQEERYKIGTDIDWFYRVRDSY